MNRAVIGCQWGDEGKGKIVDYLGQEASMSVRFNGGSNAGHSVEGDNGDRHAVHLFPASASIPGMTSVLGRGMVIDPDILIAEADQIKSRNPTSCLIVDPESHIVLPAHKIADMTEEEGRVYRIGTTRQGIGPAYSDRVARIGMPFRVMMDAPLDDVMVLIEDIYNRHGIPMQDLSSHVERWKHDLYPYINDHAREMIYDAMSKDPGVLFAGAHGMMLDIDHGCYPYVTSSNCMAAAIGPGAGIDPRGLDEVVGVVKAYSTMIGYGPFPTEMDDPLGSSIREIGREYGTTTGRPRRIGWIDIPSIKHANRVNGFNWLALTRLDILSGISPICICHRYIIDGYTTSRIPVSPRTYYKAIPMYWELPGWTGYIQDARHLTDLPGEARKFISLIEESVGVPIKLIGVGPRRSQIIDLR